MVPYHGDKIVFQRIIFFAAVTICPETKANMTQLNFTDVFHKMAAQQHPPYNITDEEYSSENTNQRMLYSNTKRFVSGTT